MNKVGLVAVYIAVLAVLAISLAKYADLVPFEQLFALGCILSWFIAAGMIWMLGLLTDWLSKHG